MIKMEQLYRIVRVNFLTHEEKILTTANTKDKILEELGVVARIPQHQPKYYYKFEVYNIH